MRHIALFLFLTVPLAGQVTDAQIPGTADKPENWLTYSGDYSSKRHSRLDQINRENVGDLRLKWVNQLLVPGKVETTPLVVDGVMYLTSPPNDVLAVDARTDRPFWAYCRPIEPPINVCRGEVNRGGLQSWENDSSWVRWAATCQPSTPRRSTYSGTSKWPAAAPAIR